MANEVLREALLIYSGYLEMISLVNHQDHQDHQDYQDEHVGQLTSNKQRRGAVGYVHMIRGTSGPWGADVMWNVHVMQCNVMCSADVRYYMSCTISYYL